MSQWILIFYNWIIWNMCFFIVQQGTRNCAYLGVVNRVTDRKLFLLFLLFGVFSLFTFFGGDVVKYQEMVETIPSIGKEYYSYSMEYIYIYLALLVNGDFYYWKLIVYGISLLLTYWTIKKLRQDNYITLLFFVGFNLCSYGATRAVLGYSMYALGLAYLCDKNIRGYIIGTLMIISSYFAHGSMLLIIALTPLCFTKLTKTNVLISLALFPLAVFLLNSVVNNYLGGGLGIFDEYISYKIEKYSDEEGGAGTNYGSLSLIIQVYLRIAILIPFFIAAIKKSIRRNLDDKYNIFVTMSYVIVYISSLFYFSTIHNNVYLFNRYIAVSPFLLYLVATPVINATRKRRNSLKNYSLGLLLLGNYTFAFLTYIAYVNHTIVKF